MITSTSSDTTPISPIDHHTLPLVTTNSGGVISPITSQAPFTSPSSGLSFGLLGKLFLLPLSPPSSALSPPPFPHFTWQPTPSHTCSSPLFYGVSEAFVIPEHHEQPLFSATTAAESLWDPDSGATTHQFLRKATYKKRLEEIHTSTQGEGSTFKGTSLPQLSTETQMNIWKEEVSFTNKRKVYGFGIESSCASSTGPPTTTIEQHEKEKQSKKS
ncbi:hypothetical protein Cgig2_006920 [Carnegiea gigantea]|uniref:Uncharacterized protein n=1 Tax=Carnegiea gigantea TaxID=171969 RepID=A0A9Q1JYV8_9CARY|nr:hypothetical protein Cgig2_006920 [Carnegiea gigantea]